MSDSYILQVKAHFTPFRNTNNAPTMAKYMRNLFPFLGIKSPERKALFRSFIAANGLPQKSELEEVVKGLFALSEREFHYIAIDLLGKFAKKLEIEDLDLLEFMIVNKSWWDSVDTTAKWVGVFFKKYPDLTKITTGRWITSDNIWLQRMSIIFQLAYKKNTDVELLFDYSLRKADSKEFFIQKAIGWALRQYAKIDAQRVKTFVDAHELAPLSRREALKHFS
ncbi:MAG: DNA alkylation repair protein [Chitinophagales bacterium]